MNCSRANQEKRISWKDISLTMRKRNFFWSPKKKLCRIGVRDLVVVETETPLCVPRNRAQDVGKVVKWLEAEKTLAPALDWTFEWDKLRIYF